MTINRESAARERAEPGDNKSLPTRLAILPIAIVVPVKNEEGNLDRCLQLLDRFSEVIVVDSTSTDRTQEIARSHGAKVLNFVWNGRYPKKRNWLLMTHPPLSPWVLFLDADELVNEEFCDQVEAAIASDRYDGYWLNYTNYFLGRKLRYGVPQRKLALFRVGKAFYERIEEDAWSNLDMEIHEHPIVEGKVGEISAPIEHNDFRGIEKFLDRHRDYARWEARRLLVLERQGRHSAAELTSRQRFKYRNLRRWWYPWLYFIHAYVVRRGFLDGTAGFHYAFYKAWYFLTIQLMARELRAHTNGESRV